MASTTRRREIVAMAPDLSVQQPALAPKRSHGTEFLKRYALIVAWAALIVVFGVLEPDTFLTTGNFATILGSQVSILVLTLALLIPLTAGDYDLSIAYNLTFSAMIVAIFNVDHGWPILAAIALALVVGGLIGFINGALVTLFNLNSFIVTLGTGTFIYGLVFWVSDSRTISGVSDSLVTAVSGERLLGIPLGFYYGVLLCIVVWYVFEFTPLGRRLLVVGRGRSVAKLSGIRVSRMRWGALVASGVLAALAGVVYTGTTGAADPTSGTSFLLPAFAAAFLGATTIAPGRFNPIGAFVAVYFLITGITGLQLLGASTYVQQLFYGGALVLAVVLSQLVHGRNNQVEIGS